MRDLEVTSAATRHELLLLRLLALTRVVILCQAATSLAFHWHATEGPTVIIGLLALLVLDNAALLMFHLRRGVLNRAAWRPSMSAWAWRRWSSSWPC